MKIGKLDKQQKLFDLYKVLGTMCRIESVNGDIVLDDELKAVVFAAIEPVLKRRIAKGVLLPVFEGDTAMQIDAFPEEDAYAVGVGEDPLDLGKSEPIADHTVLSQDIAQNGPSVVDTDAVSSGSETVEFKSGYISLPDVPAEVPVKESKRKKYVDGFEKP